ncbi:MAG TPA: adenylate/guanylate cyclase domain-containing protein, partial [Actinomycetota bacterium]|nr:adenylate/guanylate cyclase domain-containing protein [Actinomycetota bacterium]
IGVHAGEVVDGSEGYVGSAVNIAARVCAIARAGEVLVTRTVRDLTRTGLMLDYVPRGTRRLKGISEPIDLYAVRRAPDAPVSGIGRRLPAIPIRRYRGIGVTVAVGLLAFALAIAFGDVLLGRGAADGPPDGTDPQESDAPGGSPSASRASAVASPASAVASPATGEFPNEAESRLLARLDADITASCRRADLASTPTMYRFPQFFDRDNPVSLPIPVVAGLSCSPFLESDPDAVVVWQAAIPKDVEDAFFGQTGDAGLAPGECGIDESAYGRWDFGSSSGRILCMVGANDARLTWTYGEEPIIATAIREDANGALLFTWWRENARILRPATND